MVHGALGCRDTGHNPILEYRGALDFPAKPFQQIEVRIKADHDGVARFFWSNTKISKFGGFAPEKRTEFDVSGDGQWYTYRVLPFWQAEKKIIRLRLDLYDSTQFAVASIRIIELPAPTATVTPAT